MAKYLYGPPIRARRVPAAVPPDPETLSRRTSAIVADLVKPAKSDALEKVGEGERAFGIANVWLRTKTTAGAARVVSGE